MADIEDLASRGHNEAPHMYLDEYEEAIVTSKIQKLPNLQQLLEEEAPYQASVPEEDVEIYQTIVTELISRNPTSKKAIDREIPRLRKQYKKACSKANLLATYQALLQKGSISHHEILDDYLIKKSTRSSSGVLVVTVFTSPYPEVNGVKQRFSCQWNCHYCPNEPGQPRSYLLNEPGVRRANRLDFDPIVQFQERVRTLTEIGHTPDKVEVLVLGGTWESYPMEYQETFIRDVLFAANTYAKPTRRRESLEAEKRFNETESVRVIGITLETRPDTINPEMVRRLRQLGCTRIQLGVQHSDDNILQAVNRGSTRADAVRALRLLKDACFKIDIHIMPDLPGATPEGDKAMFDDFLYNSDLQADQWKIYPCQITPWTLIQQWFEQGKYRPYGLENLIDVICYAKQRVHPWIRLNRVIRDIPAEYVLGGTCCGNLRQSLESRLHAAGRHCRCIRCREVGTDAQALSKRHEAVLVRRDYIAQQGLEVFLSYELPETDTLYGFLRLRLTRTAGEDAFPELRGCALIRELHVYGRLVKTYAKHASLPQHTGFGKGLLAAAEAIARDFCFSSIAVISGVGVRTYYSARGYHLQNRSEGAFQIKSLKYSPVFRCALLFRTRLERDNDVEQFFILMLYFVSHFLMFCSGTRWII